MQRLKQTWLWLKSFPDRFLGWDLFISYAWSDGKEYAGALADRLGMGQPAYRCFLDVKDLPAGGLLDADLVAALDRSAILVLVGSENAGGREKILLEVKHFKASNRPIVAIEIDKAFAKNPDGELGRLVSDRLRIDEGIEAFKNKKIPSNDVLSKIRRAFSATRQRIRIIRWLTAFIATLLILLVCAVGLGLWAEHQRGIAEKANEKLKKSLDNEKAAKEQAIQAATLAEKRLDSRFVSSAAQHMSETASLESLPWLAASVDLRVNQLTDTVESRQRGEIARLRLASTLSQSPRLLHCWSPGEFFRTAAFSPDGRSVAIACRDQVTVWGTPGNNPVCYRAFGNESWTSAKFDASGKRLLLVGVRVLWVRDARTGTIITGPIELDKHAVIYDAWFHPKEDRIISLATILDNFDADAPLELELKKAVEGKLKSHSSLQVWDISKGEAVRPQRILGTVGAASLSPDGKTLLTMGQESHELELIDTADGSRLRTLEQTGSAKIIVPSRRFADFSLDGRLVAAMTRDQAVGIWATQTGKRLCLLPHTITASPVGVEFSPAGGEVLTAGTDGAARLWDVTLATQIAAPMRHENGLTAAGFSPDGRRIVTTSRDWTARVWDAKTGAPFTAPLRHGATVVFAQFSPDARGLLTIGADNLAKLWDSVPLGFSHRELKDARYSVFQTDATYCAKANRIVSLGSQYGPGTSEGRGVAMTWDPTTGKVVTPLVDHSNELSHAAFSPDGRLGAVIASEPDGKGRTIIVWKLATGEIMHSGLKAPARVNDLCFSHDSQRLLASSGDLPIKVGHILDPNGGWVGKGEGFVWDLNSGQVTAQFTHDKRLMKGVFSENDTHVVTVGDGGDVCMWDIATQKKSLGPFVLRAPNESALSNIRLSSNGERAISIDGSTNDVQVWETVTGKTLGERIPHGNAVEHIEISPDGRTLATGCRDGTARIWDLATGKPVTPPMGHAWGVRYASFSSDGRLLITASGERSRVSNARGYWRSDGKRNRGEVRIWDASTGEPVTLPLHADQAITKVVMTSDSRHLLTFGDDVTMLWEMPDRDQSAKMLALEAQSRAGRIISGDGGLVALDAARLVSDWNYLRKQAPERYGYPSEVELGSWLNMLASPIDRFQMVSAFLTARHLCESSSATLGTLSEWHAMEARNNFDEKVWFAVIWHHLRNGRIKQASAERWWSEQLREACEALARQAAKQGNWEEVIEISTRLIDLMEDPASRRLRGFANGKLGQSRQAFDDYLASLNLEQSLETLQEELPGGRPRKKIQNAAGVDWKDAEQMFADRVDRASTDGWALAGRGLARMRLNAWQGAAEDFSGAIENGAKIWKIWNQRGIARFHQGEFAAAIDDQTEAIRLGASGWRVWRDRGMASVSQGKAEDGVRDFEKAIQLGALDLFVESKWWGKAEAEFEKLTKKSPGDHWCWVGLGLAKLFGNDPQECIDSLSKAISLGAKDAVAWTGRGLANHKAKQFKAAIDDFSTAITLQPAQWRLYDRRARAYGSVEEWQKAVDDYSKALELGANDKWIWDRRGNAFRELGEWKKAFDDFSTAISQGLDVPLVAKSRARARMEIDDNEQAVEDCNQILDKNPTDGEAWYLRGQAQARLQRWRQAIDDYSVALDNWETGWWVWNDRSRAYRGLEDWPKALRDSSKAIELNSQDSFLRYERGFALAALGRWEEALVDYAKIEEDMEASFENRVYYVLILLKTSRLPKYAQACALWLQRAKKEAPSPEDAGDLAWICCLDKAAANDWAKVVELAEKSREKSPNDPFTVLNLGAALSRSGRHTEAKTRLEEARQLARIGNLEDLGTPIEVYASLFLAMSAHGLGESGNARSFLKDADAEFERLQERYRKNGKGRVPWYRQVTIDVLRSEATALLQR